MIYRHGAYAPCFFVNTGHRAADKRLSVKRICEVTAGFAD